MVNEPQSRVTLGTVARVATGLHRLRFVCYGIALAAGGWFVLTLFGESGGSTDSLLALTVLVWAGLALGAGYTLPRLPAPVAPGDRLMLRLRKRLQLAAYWLGLLMLLSVTGFAVFLTIRALGLGSGQG